MTEPQDQRVEKYARAIEAIPGVPFPPFRPDEWQYWAEEARGVLPVADAEIAAAVAEVERQRDVAQSNRDYQLDRAVETARERDYWYQQASQKGAETEALAARLRAARHERDAAVAKLDKVERVRQELRTGGVRLRTVRLVLVELDAALADDTGGEAQ